MRRKRMRRRKFWRRISFVVIAMLVMVADYTTGINLPDWLTRYAGMV